MNEDSAPHIPPLTDSREDPLFESLESLDALIEQSELDNIPVLEDVVSPDASREVLPGESATAGGEQLDLYDGPVGHARQDLLDRFREEIDEFVSHDFQQVVTDTCDTVMKSASTQFESLLREQLEESLRQILDDLTTEIASDPETLPDHGEPRD